MGENEVLTDSLPNGLLPGAGPVMRSIDTERWLKVEERTAELIACIQPNQLSEDRRNAVADYVQRLIMKCFRCKVCTFGSVPLKTYLPDGDIDLTVFSQSQDLKDSWANLVVDMLESEEKNDNAEFHVKEVQYIQAEVKIIKCLVENIVVDISFNQVGGLCTLCFLVEVDNLIQQNHLFKRSIILIKAWCYYESRILGAHHGLISTYALETLVLYIFHVFNNSFHGPLEVLYRFLEFFSNFDWDNFCVSLWGPVPISSLPDVTAEPPRKDKEELLLSKFFLDTCSLLYAVFPGVQENNGQPFVCKHFNVIDPLRMNNNLGRSVSKGNFYRIRSAFAFGAKKLARLLDCPQENLIFEVNKFFMNTWQRHGSGHRPDATEIDSKRLGLSTLDSPEECNNSYKKNSRGEKADENSAARVMQTPSMLYEANQLYNLKNQFVMASSILADQSGRETNGDQVVHSNELRGDPKGDYLDSDTKGQFIIPRTRSSPELTDLKDNSSTKHILSQQRLDATAAETNGISKNCRQELGYVDALSDEDRMMQQQEEQDIVNMMASASLHALNSSHQVPHMRFNLNSFQAPPSFLASMGYPQPGFFPANDFPFMDPSLSNMHFPHGLVSPRYFPGNGVNAPSEDPVDLYNGNFGLMETNSTEANSDGWNIVDVGPCSGFDLESANCDLLHPDDKLPPSPGLKYVPPHRVQQKHSRENESLQEPSDFYAEERSESSKFSSAARNNSLRSRASVESSWNESVRTPGEKWGKKVVPADLAVEGKIMTDSVTNQVEDDDQVFERPNVPGFEVAQTSGSDSMMPFPHMLTGPGSRQRLNDNAGLIPFYPTGPPIPFLTMLPFPADTGKAAHFGSNENVSLEGLDPSEDLNSPSYVRGTTRLESFEERSFDILNSDFRSHWYNLQVGRSCRNPVYPGLLPYLSSPIMVPPGYIQGRFPYDTSFRPLSSNMNMFSQLMTTSYGDYPVPVSPLSRPPNLYQEMPRYRSGTGTYLPNPKVVVKERHSSGTRRGHGEREGNWNSRSRGGPTRGHNRNQTDRSSARADRPWSSNGPQYNNGPHGVSNGVMMYPFQNGPNYNSHGDPAGINEQNEERAFKDSRYRSPDDQPSSPHNQRRV